MREIIRGLDGLHIVSADMVEVAPAYDTNAELTSVDIFTGVFCRDADTYFQDDGSFGCKWNILKYCVLPRLI